MKTNFRKLALALAATVACSAAQAGVLTWQDVVFTTTWTNNVLTLEIDAAKRTGDWTGATMLSALSIKDIGRFNSVSVSAAPKGVSSWALSARELNANGCSGGKGNGSKGICLSGAPIQLTDDMVFKFAFTGAPVLTEPHLKVNFVDNNNGKVGDLLSQKILASSTGIPVTPPVVTPPVVTPPVTPPPVVTPPVVTPPVVTPPVVTPPEVTPPVVTPPVVTPPVVTPPVTPNPADPEAPVIVPPPPPSTKPPGQDGTPLPEVVVPGGQESGEVPEPQTAVLLLAGLLLIGVALRKRR